MDKKVINKIQWEMFELVGFDMDYFILDEFLEDIA